jgi:hypothetical protein
MLRSSRRSDRFSCRRCVVARSCHYRVVSCGFNALPSCSLKQFFLRARCRLVRSLAESSFRSVLAPLSFSQAISFPATPFVWSGEELPIGNAMTTAVNGHRARHHRQPERVPIGHRCTIVFLWDFCYQTKTDTADGLLDTILTGWIGAPPDVHWADARGEVCRWHRIGDSFLSDVLEVTP